MKRILELVKRSLTNNQEWIRWCNRNSRCQTRTLPKCNTLRHLWSRPCTIRMTNNQVGANRPPQLWERLMLYQKTPKTRRWPHQTMIPMETCSKNTLNQSKIRSNQKSIHFLTIKKMIQLQRANRRMQARAGTLLKEPVQAKMKIQMQIYLYSSRRSIWRSRKSLKKSRRGRSKSKETKSRIRPMPFLPQNLLRRKGEDQVRWSQL